MISRKTSVFTSHPRCKQCVLRQECVPLPVVRPLVFPQDAPGSTFLRNLFVLYLSFDTAQNDIYHGCIMVIYGLRVTLCFCTSGSLSRLAASGFALAFSVALLPRTSRFVFAFCSLCSHVRHLQLVSVIESVSVSIFLHTLTGSTPQFPGIKSTDGEST